LSTKTLVNPLIFKGFIFLHTFICTVYVR